MGPTPGRGADAALPKAETGVSAEAGSIVSALAVAAGREAAGNVVACARGPAIPEFGVRAASFCFT